MNARMSKAALRREQMWRTWRVLRIVTPRHLAAHASTDDIHVTTGQARKFMNAMVLVGLARNAGADAAEMTPAAVDTPQTPSARQGRSQ
ncbi:MAG: hypothetical protein LBO00_04040 [Zoogloeaceae bacterium]|jgi:hypothetical protein|nr:hypothetical protein [Zoogloeaceae bacterium]